MKILAILAALLMLPALAGCGSTGQIDPAKVSAAATQVAAIYFAQQQARINQMTPGPERDKAQADLYSRETTAALAHVVGQVVVDGVATTPMPAVVPTTQPAK